MRYLLFAALILLTPPVSLAAEKTKTPNLKEKEAAVATIERTSQELISLSDQVWGYAETALREDKSSKLLADYAEKQGFQVQRGVAGMPTAFIASYGIGKPIIGILGEYDALPGISQKAQPTQEPLEEGAAGHGCGHNLLGTASMGAAVAIKDLIQAGKLKGTIRYYGTPAEESIGGKVYMAREGVFKDLDVVLAWHPGTENTADTESSQAIVDMIVEFKGKAAHAASDPWNGRSAVDGLEIFTHALNMMREHVKPTVRIHYTIVKGGDVPNVVPSTARLWVWVRDSKRAGVEQVLPRVQKVAQGAALAADVESKLTVQAGDYEILVNMAGAKLAYQNMQWLGPLKFTEQEQEFARTIQRATGVEPKGLKETLTELNLKPGDPEGGSTDVGDVSWLVPTINMTVTTSPEDAPWHGWPVVATGGMSIGHKGMIYASKALAATMVDLFLNPQQREAIRKEFAEQTKGFTYKPYIPDGPPPIPSTEKTK